MEKIFYICLLLSLSAFSQVHRIELGEMVQDVFVPADGSQKESNEFIALMEFDNGSGQYQRRLLLHPPDWMYKNAPQMPYFFELEVENIQTYLDLEKIGLHPAKPFKIKVKNRSKTNLLLNPTRENNERAEGELWIETPEGILKYKRHTGRFDGFRRALSVMPSQGEAPRRLYSEQLDITVTQKNSIGLKKSVDFSSALDRDEPYFLFGADLTKAEGTAIKEIFRHKLIIAYPASEITNWDFKKLEFVLIKDDKAKALTNVGVIYEALQTEFIRVELENETLLIDRIKLKDTFEYQNRITGQYKIGHHFHAAGVSNELEMGRVSGYKSADSTFIPTGSGAEYMTSILGNNGPSNSEFDLLSVRLKEAAKSCKVVVTP